MGCDFGTGIEKIHILFVKVPLFFFYSHMSPYKDKECLWLELLLDNDLARFLQTPFTSEPANSKSSKTWYSNIKASHLKKTALFTMVSKKSHLDCWSQMSVKNTVH